MSADPQSRQSSGLVLGVLTMAAVAMLGGCTNSASQTEQQAAAAQDAANRAEAAATRAEAAARRAQNPTVEAEPEPEPADEPQNFGGEE